MASFLDASDFELCKKNMEAMKSPKQQGGFAAKWSTQNMKGTAENPNTYEFRFLPEASKSFYKSYFYHMVSVNDKWNYMVCPKTFDASAYCPICAAVNKLYKGTAEDKKEASAWKRKQRYVANVFVVDDPRDAAINDDEKKSMGKVMLFEFPGEIEKVLRQEIEDTKRGAGMLVFEPGDEGYNFVLKVGSKPGEKPGTSWPTYNLQTAKKPCPVAPSKEEILEILDKTYNLDEYLENSKVEESFMIKVMKEGLIYSFIKTEYEARNPEAVVSEATSSFTSFEDKAPEAPAAPAVEEKREARTLVTPKKAAESKKAAPAAPEMSAADAELLAELDSLN